MIADTEETRLSGPGGPFSSCVPTHRTQASLSSVKREVEGSLTQSNKGSAEMHLHPFLQLVEPRSRADPASEEGLGSTR